MAGKKKKKKDKKTLSGSLSHIGSHLVPNAIFAAVPRSATPSLSSTWPRTSSSPVAKAVGEAGGIGFALVGDIHRPSSRAELGENSGGNRDEVGGNVDRPPAQLPSTSRQQTTEDLEENAYESVEVHDSPHSYDKKTKFYQMKNDSQAQNEHQGEGSDHFYHVLDNDEASPAVEPVYAKVDKTKKKSVRSQSQPTEKEVENKLSDEGSGGDVTSSDEDLTDVTTNDEDSSISSKAKPREEKNNGILQREERENPKSQKTRRLDKDEDTSEENSSRNVASLIAEHEKITKISQAQAKQLGKQDLTNTGGNKGLNKSENRQEEADRDDQIIENRTSTSKDPESDLRNKKRSSKKSSIKIKVQPEEEKVNHANSTVGHMNTDDQRPDKDVRQLDRPGFEGISQNVGLSDISEDEESYLLKLAKQSKFEHQRTQFERENFSETLTDSFDTNVEEVHLAESNNFHLTGASPDSLQLSNSHEGNRESYSQVESPDRLCETQNTSSNNIFIQQQRHRKSYGQAESPDRLSKTQNTSSDNLLIQQQRHLEQLIRQQESVYRQQAEQQKQQQKQSEKLEQQQQELKGQLNMLEQIQYDRMQGQLNASSAASDHDVKIQKEMIEQQEQILRAQQRQQMQYENHQERILQQQENLVNQIRQLELQQRELQSNVSSLAPKEKDLTEIRWQEHEIIRLLNEQKHHQEQYEQLHRQQMQQLQEKEIKFHQERQTLQIQQDFLKTKMLEQEEKSKQLEKELLNVSSKEKRQRHISEGSEVSHSLHAKPFNDEVDAVPLPSKEAKKSSKTKKQLQKIISENSRLLELNASLQQENAVLKQSSEALQKGSGGGSSLVMQQQIKELQEENKVLQETVHRVNVELSRYQTKYRQATVEDFPVLLSKTTKEPSQWLVNTKFLAPLFLEYDDRLKERDDIIKTYDEKLTSFKAQLMEIVKENQDLHMRLMQSKPDALDLDEWQQLHEQAKLVVEENSLLMKQQDQQQRKLKELQRSHAQDVSKLSMRIATLESEKRTLDTELEDSRHNIANLNKKYEEIMNEEEAKIHVETHLSMIDECRSVMEDLKSKKNAELDELESRLKVIQEEKQNLALCLADSKAQVSKLTKEVDAHKKTQRKLERKTLFLEKKLEHILEREVTAQRTLYEVVKVAEKTAEERDSFEEFAKSQELKQRKSKSLIQQGDLSIMGLQEKLKHNKKKLNQKVASVTGRLNEKEKEVNKIKEDYEKEINRLRELVREKQRRIEAIMGERRIFDQQLDMVWKKADQDNQQMMNTVRENQPGHEEQ